MKRSSPFLKAKISRCERGAALIEYSVLAALIVLISTASIQAVGEEIRTSLNTTAQALSSERTQQTTAHDTAGNINKGG